jgi:signal peptidase II
MSAKADTPSLFWGSLSAFGLGVALATAAVDQGSKLWLLWSYELGSRGLVALTPFLDLVLTWNTGISYGLFPQETSLGKWVLIGLKLAAVFLLWIWLARASTRLTAVALGLIIGGAVGNGIDRLHWPGVMDFLLFHVAVGGTRYNWYVFNVADTAIVIGVILLLYETLFRTAAAKPPRSSPQ